MKGQLIVLEGIDGCGKTTQINHLSQWLPISGLMPTESQLLITREPGGTSLGTALRQLLLHPPEDKAPEPLTELMLYAADRAQHVSQLILPALENGDWVLSDRFSGSTLAYQGYGRNLNVQIIEQLEQIATQGLKPDITFWLDLPIKTSLDRRGSMLNDRIEAEGINFLTKVVFGFEEIAKERKWIQIAAEIDAKSVSQKLEAALLQRFSNLQEKTDE